MTCSVPGCEDPARGNINQASMVVRIHLSTVTKSVIEAITYSKGKSPQLQNISYVTIFLIFCWQPGAYGKSVNTSNKT